VHGADLCLQIKLFFAFIPKGEKGIVIAAFVEKAL
jgi:hypothetical protein